MCQKSGRTNFPYSYC